jgi:hypothetical protein
MKFIIHFNTLLEKRIAEGWEKGILDSWEKGVLILPPNVSSLTIIDETQNNKIIYQYMPTKDEPKDKLVIGGNEPATSPPKTIITKRTVRFFVDPTMTQGIQFIFEPYNNPTQTFFYWIARENQWDTSNGICTNDLESVERAMDLIDSLLKQGWKERNDKTT